MFSNNQLQLHPYILLVFIILLTTISISYLIIIVRRKRNAKLTSLKTTEVKKPSSLWHELSVTNVLKAQSTNQQTGLSAQEIKARFERTGANKLHEKPPQSAWWLFLAQFKSLLIQILILAAAVSVSIGDFVDGIVILAVVLINAVLGFYQEFRAEKSISALKNMLALQATVRRDGIITSICAEQLVPGDIVLLEAGAKIPADGRIISANNIIVDESSLTGESLPQLKQTDEINQADTPLSERSNMLYMNNTVASGRAEMVVTETGMDTEIGKLASFLAQTSDTATPLQLELDRLGKRLAFIALTIVLLLFMLALWRGEPLIQTAFTAIALAVAAIPEGLPTVVTVTLALGMHRMVRQHAIVKRLSAIETLGCTTVICTDKTGTLTYNQMTVREIFYQDQLLLVTGEGYKPIGDITSELPSQSLPDLSPILTMLISCNNCDLQQAATLGDPMERALCVLAAKASTTKTHAQQLTRIAEIPFDTAHKFMATFHQQGDEIRLFVKGAPEILLQLATSDAKNPSSPYWGQNERMASQGLRVLAVAERTFPASELQSDNLFFHVQDMHFVGLIGLLDPPRNGVKQAILHCQKAGIQVKMITGDQLLTAKAIANELNLLGDVVDGTELTSMDDETLSQRIEQIAVFARTVPAQKLRIVNALQAKGHVVAMTGDGVNDAPALQSADIGIAMGISGTDVAKEASSMILMDDNFTTIVKAIKEGRGIYDNMVKFIRFQLSTNIGAILTVAAAPFLGLPVPFTAVQLLWVNIIMDGPPAMSLGVDPVRTQIMKDHPRAPDSQILSWKRLGNLLSYGITMAVGTLGILYYGLLTGTTEHATSLAYTTFIGFQVFNVFNARSEKHTAFNRHFFANKWLWTAIIAVIALQVLLNHWQPAQLIFHTYPLSLFDWYLATAVAASVLILDELRKLLSILLNMIKPKTSHHHKQSQ